MKPPSAITFSQPSDWVREHLYLDFDLIDFSPNSRVLDIGCGYGKNLERLCTANLMAEGVDPDPTGLDYCRSLHFKVQQAMAERLPFADAEFDGAVLDGVLQFTLPHECLAEAARVLKPGGTLRLLTQGFGYGLHVLHSRPGKGRFYAIRMIMNTLFYSLLRKRLPGWLGDTLCFLPAQLRKLSQEAGFEIVTQVEGPRFLGQSVFLYACLRKPMNQHG